jgi:hypothetical protein
MGVDALVSSLKTKFALALSAQLSQGPPPSAANGAAAGNSSASKTTAGASTETASRLSASNFSKDLKPTFLKLANILVVSLQDIKHDALSEVVLQQLERMLPEGTTGGVGAVWKLLEGLASESWGQIQKLKDDLRREFIRSATAAAAAAAAAGNQSAVPGGSHNDGTA